MTGRSVATRLAYLTPSDAKPQNIWITLGEDFSTAQQLTASSSGVLDFAPSPDGTMIAFAERDPISDTADIMLLNLETGTVRRLTNCVDGTCMTPVWHPNGEIIAYQRIDFTSGPRDRDLIPTRVWLVDITAIGPITVPLFANPELIGYDPQWSADGTRIAVYVPTQGSLVYDLVTGDIFTVANGGASKNALSPDGSRLASIQVEIGVDQAPQARLQIMDLANQEAQVLLDTANQFQYEKLAWSPDGSHLAFTRRPSGEVTWQQGYQLYLIDPESGEVQQLTDDPTYTNGFFSWDTGETQLVIQRVAVDSDQRDTTNTAATGGAPSLSPTPELWVYMFELETLRKVAINSYQGHWVP